jgi:hypothetical protein
VERNDASVSRRGNNEGPPMAYLDKEEGARAMFLKHRSIYDASVGVGGIYATFALTGPVGWGIGAGVLVYTAITIGWDSTHHANENK